MFVNKIPKQNHIIFLILNFKFYLFLCLIFFTACSEKNDNNKQVDANGLLSYQLTHDQISRSYSLYVPENYIPEKPASLLFNFHGGGSDGLGHFYVSDMRSIADTANVILVYPDGYYGVWNSSLPSNPVTKNTTDDFGFISKMINEISSEFNINTLRVYATGFSNGGDMSYALANILSDKFAAVAPVAGLADRHTAQNSNPSATAVLSIHGTQDSDRPYFSGLDGYYFTIDEMLSYWRLKNNCDPEPTIESFTSDGNTVELLVSKNCRSGTSVDHYKVINGGHYWLNIERDNSSTNEIIWNFLSRFNLNGLR